MNTHSRQADCRMEVLGVHAAMNGADAAVVRGNHGLYQYNGSNGNTAQGEVD